MKRLAAIVLAAIAAAAAGCNGEVVEPPGAAPLPGVPQPALLAPSRATFRPVGDMLQTTCGTLDCHGQIGRNLRLYGARGLRLDPKDNSAENPTTAREYDESYWSTIGLEPEVMSDVVSDRGAHPERLSMVRKARGTERHKGNTLFVVGDPGDRCLISWLADAVDTAACKTVVDRPRPVAPDPQP
jgi:hypothetical protein